jgi:asparagine synthase (glutamine-hydrolysing)
MTDSMVHRGPDSGGTLSVPCRNGCLSLGARRLAIQDLSAAGGQPMRDPTSGNVIVFNGEIYNFHELREELVGAGLKFETRSDTEVILHGYRRWGLKVVERLCGMFAFGLWDAARDELILARDRLGVKPLYYTETGGQLLFASELRAVLSSNRVSRELCQAGLESFLELGAVREPHTLIENVLSLPAGTMGVWGGSGLSLKTYWPLAECFTNARSVASRAETVGDIRSRLVDAVRSRLISDAPIGVFLSGGLDSSTVTALAAQQSERPVQTVSVVFKEAAYSEKPFIDSITRLYQTRHTEICLTDMDFAARMPAALDAMDQPTFDGVNTYVVAEQARKAGLTVALSGIGGDELFGGYRSFAGVPRLRRLKKRIPVQLRGPASWAVRLVGRDSDQARKVARWISADDHNVSPEALYRELFGPSERAALFAQVQASPSVDADFDAKLDDFNSVSLYELSTYLKNVLLRDTDVMSMAHSLEVREPLLDHRLVELVSSIPGPMKGSGKQLLIEAMRHDLPADVLKRPKRGFAFPLASWLRQSLRREVESVLLETDLGSPLDEVLKPHAMSAVWQRFLDDKGSWVRPWSLYVLKYWVKNNL